MLFLKLGLSAAATLGGPAVLHGFQPAASQAATARAAELGLPDRFKSGSYSIPHVTVVGAPPWVNRLVTETYQQASKAPDSADAVGELGMYYFRAGSMVEALACFQRACELDPKAPRWPYYLALTHESLFESDKAVTALKRATALDPRYAPFWVRLAELNYAVDPKEAGRLYQTAAELSPLDPRVHFGLGQCARRAGQTGKAVEHYRRALALAPNYVEAKNALTDLLSGTKRPEESAADSPPDASEGSGPPVVNDPLQIELYSRGSTPEWLVSVGEQLLKTGHYDMAIQMLEQAIKSDGDRSQLLNSIGVVYALQGKPDKALEKFYQVLREDPFNELVRSHLANTLPDVGKYDEAEKFFREALDRNDRHPYTLEGYGLFLIRVGRPADALPFLERLVRVRPNVAVYNVTLALAHVSLGANDKAVELYLAAQAKAPGDPGHLDYLARHAALLMARQKAAAAAGIKIDDNVMITVKKLEALADAFAARGMSVEAGRLREAAAAKP